MYRTKNILIPLLLSLASLLPFPLLATDSEPPIYKHKFLSFGTYIDVMITNVSEPLAQQAFNDLENEFKYMQRTWWPWAKGALARINSLLPSNEWFSIPPSVRPLLIRAQQLSIKSDHLFNPAIGKLVELWGFHQLKEENNSLPTEEELKKIVNAKPRMTDIEIKGIRIRGHNPTVFLDLGAIAKGYAIERMIKLLQSKGIHDAIINTGGDLKVIGSHGTRPWSIAIRNPSNRKSVIALIQAKPNEAVFTSGDYERYFIHQNIRYHHILDPRSGYPAKGFVSVTVIHTDATLADAAATAIFVAGPARWKEIAVKMGINKVLVIDDTNKIMVTRAMRKQLKFLIQNQANIITVEL